MGARDKSRVLIVGQDKDSAYAIRNVFEAERVEIEVSLSLDVAKSVLTTRHIDFVILSPGICMLTDFDLVDFQIDHGLDVPMIIVGGESTGIRRRIRSKKGVRVLSVAADGFKLIDLVRGLMAEARAEAQS